MSNEPALIVRVRTNLDELKQGLVESKAAIARTTEEIESLAGTGSSALDTLTSSAEALTVKVEALPGVFGQLRIGLNEAAEGAGLTYEKMGLLGSATAGVATAMAAWDIGRTIAEFFELDDKIANTTAKLMGWGDLTAEIAGAKTDALVAATKHAGREITDYTEAVKINNAWFKEWNDTLNRAHGPEESAKQLAKWRAEIQLVRDAGTLPGLTKDIESHSFSMNELKDRYGISIGAVQEFARETKTANEAATAAARENAKETAAAQREKAAAEKEYAALVKEVQKIEADKNTASLTGLLGFSKAEQKASQERFENESKAITEIQKAEADLRDFEMKGSLDTATYQIMKIWERVDQQEKAFAKLGGDTTVFNAAVESLASQQADAIIANMKRASDAAITTVTAASGAIFTLVDGVGGAADLMAGKAEAALDRVSAKAAAAQQYTLAGSGHQMTAAEYDAYYQTPQGIADIIRNKGKRYYEGEVLPRAGGGPVASGTPYLVGERGPELFVPDRSGAVVASGGSGGNTYNITNYITQPLGTPDAIGEAITARMKSLGMRF